MPYSGIQRGMEMLGQGLGAYAGARKSGLESLATARKMSEKDPAIAQAMGVADWTPEQWDGISWRGWNEHMKGRETAMNAGVEMMRQQQVRMALEEDLRKQQADAKRTAALNSYVPAEYSEAGLDFRGLTEIYDMEQKRGQVDNMGRVGVARPVRTEDGATLDGLFAIGTSTGGAQLHDTRPPPAREQQPLMQVRMIEAMRAARAAGDTEAEEILKQHLEKSQGMDLFGMMQGFGALRNPGQSVEPTGRPSPLSRKPKAAPARELSTDDQMALEWATQNPNDPRSAQIRQRLGM
jgi:hypothetical protein